MPSIIINSLRDLKELYKHGCIKTECTPVRQLTPWMGEAITLDMRNAVVI